MAPNPRSRWRRSPMRPDWTCPPDGLLFPPCGVDDLPHVMRPRERGGVLDKSGTVEVVSSLERDGRPVFRDLRWGVYVVLEAPNDYAADCFRQYGLKTDFERPLCGDVQALSSDRARAEHLDPVGRAAPGADRPAARISRRRRRGRQATICAQARCSTAKAATRCGAS